jgi:hypothetical protein
MMKLSRSKIDLYNQCPRCFYNDVKLKIQRPKGYPFNLNNAVDMLLKKEFDHYRQTETSHPLQVPLGLVPANLPMIASWRTINKGVRYHHEEHDCTYYGCIDDLWYNPNTTEYHVVDYKATAKKENVTELPDWADAYRKQAEFYQWLLRHNGLNMSNIAYFVYCTGNYHAPAFNAVLNFHLEVIPYEGNDAWVEPTINSIQACLQNETPPSSTPTCDHCRYKNA